MDFHLVKLGLIPTVTHNSQCCARIAVTGTSAPTNGGKTSRQHVSLCVMKIDGRLSLIL